MEAKRNFIFFAVFAIVCSYRVSGLRLPPGSELRAPNGTGDTVVIGDMLLQPELHNYLMTPSNQRKVIAAPEFKWPEEEGGYPTVPFQLSIHEVEYEIVIRSGMIHWEEHTCIRFREKAATDTSYVNFIKNIGCWSYVGKMPITYQPQDISIGDGCQYLGTVIHEIGHAIGFIHEQMRPDRDDYLEINLDNVDAVNQDQFTKYPATNYFTYDQEYDYTSVMQYGSTDFSKNGRITMATRTFAHQGLLGKGEVLSHRDKKAANTHYGCLDKWSEACNQPQSTCLNGGYLGKDCSCVCPPGTTGSNCETLAGGYYDSVLSSCNEVINEEKDFASPYYPTIIPQGTWCVYQLEAPEGKKVKLTFNDFAIDRYTTVGYLRCATAFLEIRDTEMYEGAIMCGDDVKEHDTFVSSSTTMILYLEVPYRGTSKGFQASVSFVNGTEDDLPGSNDDDDDGGFASRHCACAVTVLLSFFTAYLFQWRFSS